jgi:hypothetical protein
LRGLTILAVIFIELILEGDFYRKLVGIYLVYLRLIEFRRFRLRYNPVKMLADTYAFDLRGGHVYE